MKRKINLKTKLDRYRRFFTEANFWGNLGRFARRIGLKSVYTALLMYYAYRRKETPFWAKNIVIGVLGYLLAPLDFMPDITPIIGYTDDLGILSFGLVTIASYINEEVRANARGKLSRWFPNYNAAELVEIDQKIK